MFSSTCIVVNRAGCERTRNGLQTVCRIRSQMVRQLGCGVERLALRDRQVLLKDRRDVFQTVAREGCNLGHRTALWGARIRSGASSCSLLINVMETSEDRYRGDLSSLSASMRRACSRCA